MWITSRLSAEQLAREVQGDWRMLGILNRSYPDSMINKGDLMKGTTYSARKHLYGSE